MRLPEFSEDESVLFYPCSGKDWIDIFHHYAEQISVFVFTDLHYQFDSGRITEFCTAVNPDWTVVNGSVRLLGQPYARIEYAEDPSGRSYRFLHPAWLSVNFQNTTSNKKLHVIWRRGFGEYALREFRDASIDIFCHRGDSDGEGGSATHFLSDRRLRHPLLSRLYSTLRIKLKPNARVISDGSNTKFKHLLDAACGKLALGCTTTVRGMVWCLTAEVPWHKAHRYGRCFEWFVQKEC